MFNQKGSTRSLKSSSSNSILSAVAKQYSDENTQFTKTVFKKENQMLPVSEITLDDHLNNYIILIVTYNVYTLYSKYFYLV